AQALAKTEEAKKTLRDLQEIKDPIEREEKIIHFVKRHLKLYSSWVLIFDNVEKFIDIEKDFPQDPATWGRGKVILTTRNSNIQNNRYVNDIIQIGELNPTEKLSLFTKIMNQGKANFFTFFQSKEAKNFLEKIPPFPLDISISAYYLKATNITYNSYLESLSHYNKNFIDVQESLLRDAGDYVKTRYSIIILSLQKLINTHKDFGDLLLLCSLLNSQNIPKEFLDVFKEEYIVDNFIYNLKKYSLIINQSTNFSNSTPIFSIHPTTQEISLTYLIGALNTEKRSQLSQNIAFALEKYVANLIEKESFLKMSMLVSHCERLLEHKSILTEAVRSSIKGELGCMYYYLSDYKKARQLLEESLQTLKVCNAKNEKFKSAHVHVHLGIVYRRLGNFKKAKNLLEHSLTLYNKYFPNNYSNIAQTLAYLGGVYRDLGDYTKAKNLLDQSLTIYKKHFPQNFVDIGRASALLGSVYRNMGDFEKAKDALEFSLIGYKKHFPENHLRVAWASTLLGGVYRELGSYEKAKLLLEKSLTIYRAQLPESHVDVAWTLIHLGSVYRELQNFEKAKNLLTKGLTNYKKNFPEDHPDIAWASLHLGNLFMDLSDHNKAKYFLEKSLKIYEKSLGVDRNETGHVLKSLAQVYFLEGYIRISEAYFQKALKILQKNKHSDVYIVFENLAELYLKKSAYAENKGDIQQSKTFKAQSVSCIKRAFEIVKTHFSENSPHIIRIQDKLKKLSKE
ncbi:MAG TPA: tetratricopeptide repeat protein, partial [Alphaproteobacteria bacterium]|nr:tetratricopeptide repeat protein [Alphaproteobacteria bacterium]